MVLRIFNMIANDGFLAALECTKFVFRRGFAADPTGVAYSAPSDTLVSLRGPASKGRGDDKQGKGREEGERKGT